MGGKAKAMCRLSPSEESYWIRPYEPLKRAQPQAKTTLHDGEGERRG